MIARLRVLLAVLPLGALLASPLAAQTIDWTRQLGTSSYDESYGVSADGLGNVFLSGYTGGDLGGTNAGGTDAFVMKLTDETFVPEPATCGMLLSVLFSFAAGRNRPVRS